MSVENHLENNQEAKEKPKFRTPSEIRNYHNARRLEVRLLEEIAKKYLPEEDYKTVYAFAVKRVEEIVKEQIQDLREFEKQSPAEPTEEERRPEFYIEKIKNI